MTTAEKQRRRLLRKKAKARRARLLFREYVAKHRKKWDVVRDAALNRAAKAEQQFDRLIGLILDVAPDFPLQNVLRGAPDYLQASLRMRLQRQRATSTIFDVGYYDVLGDNDTFEALFYEMSYYIEEPSAKNAFRAYMAFTMRHPDPERSVGMKMFVSEDALLSRPCFNEYFGQLYREAAQQIITHLGKHKTRSVRT